MHKYASSLPPPASRPSADSAICDCHYQGGGGGGRKKKGEEGDGEKRGGRKGEGGLGVSCLHTSLAPLPHFCRSIKEKLAREYVCAFSSFRLLSNEVCTTTYNVKDPCSPLQKSPLRAGGDGGNRGWTMRRSSQSYYVKGCRKKERDSPTSHMPAFKMITNFSLQWRLSHRGGEGGESCVSWVQRPPPPQKRGFGIGGGGGGKGEKAPL